MSGREKSLLDRMNDEVSGFDAAAMERFTHEHGMTPLQYALTLLPIADAERVYKERPDLRPPKKKPPPVGNR